MDFWIWRAEKEEAKPRYIYARRHSMYDIRMRLLVLDTEPSHISSALGCPRADGMHRPGGVLRPDGVGPDGVHGPGNVHGPILVASGPDTT